MSRDEDQQLARRFAALKPASRRAFLARMQAAGLNFAELPIVRLESEPADDLPLSMAQRGLWLTWQLDQASPAYNMPGLLHLSGPLDEAALRRSMGDLARRHEVLRTVFVADAQGEPWQRILPDAEVVLSHSDLRPSPMAVREAMARQQAQAFAEQAFQLDAQAPWRAALFRIGDAEHLLAIVVHHIAADAWSLRILMDELLALYEAHALSQSPSLASLPIRYADYAVWQRNWMEAGEQDRQLAYWQASLGSLHPVLDLPLDRPREAMRHAPEGRLVQALPAELSAKLREVAKAQGTSLYMVMLALFGLTLNRLTGQTDIRIGSPTANRLRAETHGLVGYVANVQVLRAQMDTRLGFSDWLSQVRETVLGAQSHQDLPFDALVAALLPERQAGVHPLFQVKCTEQSAWPDVRLAAGLEVRLEELSGGRAHFDLSFDFVDSGQGIETTWAYAADLFEDASIDRMAALWVQLAQAAVRDPSCSLGDGFLPAVPVEDACLQGEAVAWADSHVLSLWQRSVARLPQTDAVRFEDQAWTYQQLDAQSERLAQRLRALGVGPEVRVGVHAPREGEFVLGLLAVLKAGGVFVPLDPQLPADRLAYQLADSGAGWLLSTQAPSWTPDVPVLALAFEHDIIDGEPAAPLRHQPHPDQAAYVIYTSGSTGRPKGVVVGHGALANYVQAVLARLALPGTVKSLAMVSTVAADLGHTSLFGALCSGRTLHLISAQRVFDPDAFAQYMHAHQVDVLKIVPSHLQALMQAARPEQVLPRHTLVVGGEATSWRLLDQIQALKPGCRVLNHYGPTETTVGVLTQAASEADRHATHLPLGRPLANVDAWVLDADLNPVPQGAAGELYLGGSALARGYQQRAGATAERFVPHPWQAGARLYRTGDRVRQLGQQGGLAFLGRVDDQVKVRGYRVELSEVASALRAQPGVHEAAVVLVQEDDGRSALAAYVVPQADQAAQPLDVVALKAGLAAVLPDYMVPSVIMVLAQLPLNANGKLDRQALPKPQAMAGDAHEAPQGEVEETLAAVWAEVLGRDQVSRHDNFFELGGDSILSLKVVARARKRGVHLLPKQLFESQSLSGLALSVSKPSAKAARSAEPLIARLDAQRRQAPMPLSSAQARQWFLWQLDPASSAYHVSGGLQLQGELNLDALRRAFQALVDRHESLRTVFRASADGLAEQWIQAVVALDVPLIDVSQADEAERTSLAQAQARQVNQTPFDLGNGPLLRVAVIRMDARTHLLAVAMHHIVSDGWSMQVIVDEFVALYRAHLAGQEASLPPLAIQYADYAAWQRQWLADGEKDRQLSYWKNQLESGLEDGEHPVLQLATDHPRQAQPVYRAAHHQQTLPVALVHDLQRRAHEQGATLFMALLAGWQALLQRYTGQDDIRVGVPVANRHRIETQGVVGFFVNTQVLRNLLHARMPLSQVLAQAKDAALGAQSNQDLPFEQLVEALQPERSLNHSPLFQVLLNHQRDQRGALAQVPGLTVQPWDLGEQAAQFELALHTTEDAQGGVHIMLSYARELFEPETIARLVGHYQAMLQALASQPDLPLGDVAWLSAPEQAVLGQWSVNRTHHADGTQVHHLIERQAARTPDAPALVFEQTTLSYGQLNRRANQLAHLLIGQGLQPEVLVGIAVERSIEMVVGLLAIMKAGGAYVPLDPEYPKDRLAYMMQDSGMGLLLTQSHVLPGLPVVETATGALRTWCLDTLDLSAEPDHDPCVPLHGDSLAYVIYTSGSTGRPKGAANRHRSLHNRLAWMQSAYALTPADTVLQKTPFSFDVSVWEFFWPLMVGARLAVARPGDHRDPDRLIGLIQRHGVSTLHFVPSMLQAFMAHQGVGVCTSLRRIVCSGEALPAELQNQVFSRLPGAGLYNLYGPTEAAIDVTHWTCRDDGLNHVAIGQPIADTTVRVLDAGLNLLPQGVAGELYLGGIGLARGYVGRHGLTAERFVADPFSTTGERLYRTGDLVRWRLDGQIEYLGRIDHQVKIRGFRIELGEIEAQLLRQAGVREAVVVVQPLAAGARLVAYVSGAQVLHTPGIKAQLALDLPDYMVPALIMVLDQLPLNANGKVDRKALPAPDVTGHDSEAEAPQGEAERVLAGIWSEVLSVQAIGRQDNFFELGGDSILSLQIVARARKAGWWITPRQMFERQRVADLAQVMQPVAAMTAAGQDAAQGEVPLLPIQCEFFGRAVPTRAHWNQALLLQTHLPLDTGLLAQALHALVQQHDGLRLRYRQEAGVWQQAYGAAALQPELLWIRQARDATELEALCDEAHRSLDLAHGPLMRALAVSMADGTNRLLLTAHHLVVDGVSWRVLVEDLHLAYGQLVAGQALSLPARTSSYQSWARRLLDSLPVHAADMPWWSKLADVPFSLPLAQAESPHGSRGQQASVTRQLDAVATQALLKDAPAAYRTQVNDLLLTALGRALCRWSGHERILIDLEGHGRENLHADIDLSRTVGWFTSLYPIELDALGEPGQALKRVKEHLRQVPHKGVGHGLLKHLGTVAQREALAALPKAQVVFNYLGQIDSGLDALADWTPASESLGTPMDPQAQPWHALSVSAQVAQGVLSLSMSYPASRVDAGTMSSLLDDCLSELHALITHCGSGAAGLTPSDVPLSGLNQHQLDALALPAVRVDDLYPLSPMQEGMLFHSVYEPSGTAYTNQLRVDLQGLDAQRFRAAWQAVFQRHDVLRTGFLHQLSGQQDKALQWVDRLAQLPWTEHDWQGQADQAQALEALAQGEMAQGFDLATPPLMRLVLVRTGPDTHHIVWTVHHLLLDGWSTSQLLGEVLRHYGGQSLPALSGRYRDYIGWLQAQDASASQAYWREQLGQLAAPTRLVDALPKSKAGQGHGVQSRGFDAQATQGLVAFAKRERITLNTLVQGAWALLLQRYSGQEAVAFGATVAGRPSELAGAEQMLGLFINTLPVICAPKASQPVGEWLRALQAQNLAAREHEHTPLYEIQRWAGLGGQGLFDSILVFENFPVDQALNGALPGGLRVDHVHSASGNHYPFTVRVLLCEDPQQPASGPCLRLDYLHAEALVDVEVALRLAAQFERLLQALAMQPVQALGEIDMLDAPAPLATVKAQPATSVLALWQRSVAQSPQTDAVRFEEQAWSYQQLDEQSERLAQRLRALGVGPEVRVGVHAPREGEFVLGLLAVLKAGGVCVPLDPQLPADRLAYQLADSGAGWLLSAQTPSWTPDVPVLALAFEHDIIDGEPAAPLRHQPHPDQAAYVIYTSGSTGRPKGVVVGHGALANYVQAVLARLALPGTVKSLAMVSTVAADLGHTSLFGALCSGRTLHLISAQRAFDPDAFAQYMHAHQVEVLKIVPSHLHALMQAARPEQVLPRHTLVVGGEATSWRLLDQIQALSPGCRVVNHYGPTETTVGVLTQAADESDRDAPQLTIGHALDHAQAFVLDAQLHRVPQGASGELYIGGLALARGYQAQPAQTAQRFVPHPWLPGERLYRTGDRVRQLADSSLVFLGRVDDQVKIRGYRVEPGEIAALLRTLPGVREAEVTVAQTEDGRAQLHAYAVAQPGQTLQGTTLREALARELPDYMVPVAVMVLAALPLNANGKVDRKALPQPVPEVAERFEAPQGEAETLLAAVWAEVLGIERVGRQDNFFELGGDSILTLQIVARARKRGLRLTPRQLMEGQTVAAVAAVAQTKATAAVASQAAPEAPQAMEPTPVQAWFLEQAFAEPAHWNQSLLLTPTRAIDAAHLRAAFGHLVAHHEALRSRFAQDSHGPWRITLADHVPAETYFECIDLSQVQDANAAITQCGERLQRSLNLSQGPLLRAAWMDLGPARGARLLVVAHHLVVDGVSWRVILEDLQTLYSQLSAGQAIDLPAKTTSHAQWSRALLSHAQSEAMQTELAYWQSLVGQAEPSLPSAWPNGENTVASVDTVEAVLSTDLTTQLLRGTAQAYRTQINDLLLTALARTLCGWTGRDSVLVELEGHGREEGIDATLDLTRSVGWFTSLYPIRLHAEQGDPGAAIKAVKEQQRAVPGKGLGYGVLRYLSKQGKALREGAYPQITFNYLGQFDASLQADGLWRLADEPAAAGRSPVSLRRSWFDVTASVRAGQLHMAWTYSRSLHDHEEVAGLLQSYQVHLEALIAHCSSGAAGLTPSDVPLSGLNQHQLDALALPAVRVDDLYPLSPMQEGMLFHSVYEPSGTAYTNQLRVDLQGLDAQRFRAAWQAVFQRHDVLRTGFLHQLSGQQDKALQWVDRLAQLPWTEHDWQGQADQAQALEALAQGEMAQGFDLATPPLMRLVLVRTGPDTHHIVWTVHHLLLDGWSTSQLLGEVLRHYGGQSLPALSGRYRDYIGWLQAQDASASQAYWREQLGQLAAPTRLVDALPKSEAGQGHGVQSRGFDAQATQGLVAFAKRERITLNTLVQGAWALLLQRYSGQEAVAFGATVAGRPSELAGAEQMLGLFINTLPVICAPKASQPVGEWLRALQAQNLAAREHEHTPLYEIQRWAGLGGQGLFDSILVFENYPVDQVLREALPGGLHATVVDKRDETSYPVTLSVVQDDALDLQLSHDRALIDDEVATRIASHLVNLLQALVGDSHAAVASLAVLDDHERSQLQSWGLNPERHAGLDPVHLTIARQASLRPQATALVFEDQVLSHFELNRRANRLAHRLIAQGVRPESRVGIAVARSVEMIVGLLAILKAGATYVPLDPEYPSDRLAYMVDDSGLQLVLTQTSLLASLPPSEVPVLAIDAPADVSPHHDHDPIVPVHGHQLAYIIYTSGSTGQPKGVGISHQALAEHAQVSIGFFGLTPEDRMLQFATLNFDGFIEQVYPTLCAGAAIVLRGPQLWDSETFYQALIDKRISVADLTTAYWFLLAQDFARQAPRDYGALRQVHAGGEAMPPEGLKAWRDAGLGHIKLLNTYGPTEATVTATVLDCGPYVRGSLPAPAQMPIGSPLAGRQLHVLDANLQSVPVGVAGELCIGGELLARGYLNRPGLSAERFVANPFTETGEEGGRLYRTGDLVRWSAQGQLEYLGRIDHQVKIRGFRIELGEIEAQLLAEPQVREAVVVAQTAASGARLLAYVSPQEGHSLDNATLRQSLAQALPEYMVPGVIVVLERLPLNPNGKVDRKALPEPDRAGHEDHYEAPQGEVEQALAAIWAEVLGIVRVGRQDNFFELGGHSLAVLQVQAKAQEALSTRLPLKTYFEQPSLQGISAALHSQRVQAQATETADIDEMAALLESLES